MDRTEEQAQITREERITKGKEEQAQDRTLAIADYKRAQQKNIENMLRLRQLRLARKAS